MTDAIRRAVAELRGDSPENRLRGVRVFVAMILAGLIAYLLAAIRFVPDIGIHLLIGMTAVAVLVAAGPRLTMPLYFATWFCGSAIVAMGSPVSLNRVAAASFLISSVVFFLRRPFRVPPVAPVLLLVALTVHAVATGLLKKPPGEPASVQQLFYLATALLVASAFRTREDFRRLVAALIAIACALTSVGLAEFVYRGDLFSQFSDTRFFSNNVRINGVSKNAIQYAFNACWAVPWAVFAAAEAKSRRGRFLAMLCLLMLIVASILTANRQTPVIIAAIMIPTLLFLRSPVRRRLVLLTVAGAILLSPYIAYKMVDRFRGLEIYGARDVSIAQREDKFKIAMNIFAENPWAGIGLDNYKFYWYEKRTIGDYYRIHFEMGTQQYIDLGYVQILTETGIAGFAMFLLLGATSFAVWRRCRIRAANPADTFVTNGLAAAAGGFAQLVVSLLVQDTLFFPHTFLLFGLFFCLVAISRSERGRPQGTDLSVAAERLVQGDVPARDE